MGLITVHKDPKNKNSNSLEYGTMYKNIEKS